MDQKLKDRYEQLLHAMQSGVAMEMNLSGRQPATEPKHLRVGVNAAMCDHAALVKVLIDKGILTDEEYLKAMVEKMEEEVSAYETRLTESTGAKITLA